MKACRTKILYLIITYVSISSCQEPQTNNIVRYHNVSDQPFDPSTLKSNDERSIYERSAAFYRKNFRFAPINGGFLVARNGKILFEKYNGTLHLRDKDTIAMNTPMHIASTSKTFTAMAVLYLAQQKLLDINDSLQKYFPNFPYRGMTIKTLLNHRSGLANYMNVMDPKEWKNGRKVQNQDVLNFFVQKSPPLQGSPDRQFTYCNTNYVLLALIIEQVAKKPLPEYLKQTFFDPLEMKNTFVCNSAYQKDHAPSYRWNGMEEGMTWLDDTYGDKNICSTPRDLLKWDQALYHYQFFTQETIQSAFTPYSFEKPGAHNYGLGWRMHLLNENQKLIYHNGWWHGSNACFFRVISDSITIIAIGNKMNTNIYKVKPLVEDISSFRFRNGGSED
jgi:CubicO group peptidase (beta-lactamase class C family)